MAGKILVEQADGGSYPYNSASFTDYMNSKRWKDLKFRLEGKFWESSWKGC